MNLTKAVFSKYSKLYDVNVKLDTVTIVIGQNDSGKSTLLEGIFYAASTNIAIPRLKSFSKVLDDDAVIRIFFEINERDLNDILVRLGLKISYNDKLLIHHQFELECIYPRHGEQMLKQVKVHPQFRARFNDDKRLNIILDELIRLLEKRITLIKPNLEIGPETLRPKKYNVCDKESYPLNYLFYSSRRLNDLNKTLGKLLENTRIQFLRDNDRIIPKVIQTFHEKDLEFSLEEMGDGSRKTISMIIKIYLSGSGSGILLLDEPDSSMHSKLIKNLINYLKGSGKQVIVSTHNEIFINEFEEKNLRYIFWRSPVYSRVEDSDKSKITKIFSDLGIDVSYKRSALLSSQLILLVEGKDDKKYIGWLLQKTKRDKELSEYRIDYVDTGSNEIPDIQIIDKINRTDLPVLLIRDRDENQQKYFQKHEIELGDRIHIWKRREIENYFLSYRSIHRAIKEHLEMEKNVKAVSIHQVKNRVKQLAQSLIVKTSLLSVYNKYKSIPLTYDYNLISRFIKKNSHLNDDDMMQLFYKQFFEHLIKELGKDRVKEEYITAKEHLQKEWNDENKILETCPGKDLIEKIKDWVLKEYKILISEWDLYRKIESEEIDQDFHKLVDQIIQKCAYGAAAYLRNYDPPRRLVRFLRNQFYFNAYYYVPLPEFNNNLLYFTGIIDKKGSDRNKNSILTTYDWGKGKIVKKTSIKEKVKIINMEYDSVGDLLFTTAEIKRKDELVDSIFVVDPRTDHIYKYELLPDSIEGKEGALSDLVINAIDRKHGIIYAGSVYAHGGRKTLYMIKYLIIGDNIRFTHRQLNIGRYGPLSICSSIKNEKIYILNQEDKGDLGLVPVISVIRSNSGNTVDKIYIPTTFGHISPYEGHLMSIDSKGSTLAVVINEELYMIDLSTKKVIKIFKDRKYSFVAISPVTSKLYVIAEEEDLESSQPHFNSLHVIESNLQRHQITKFDPVIEANNIRCFNSIICINFRHKEIENEYSFWLFKEDIKTISNVSR